MRKQTRQEKYIDRIGIMYKSDNDNLFPKPMSDAKFREIIADYLLGLTWYTPNPVSQEQANVYMAIAIIEKFNVKKD